MSNPYEGDSTTQNVPGIKGTNTAGGVALIGSTTGGPSTSGVNLQKIGVSGNADTNGVGVEGKSQSGTGVLASSVSGVAVFATSQSATAVEGYSVSGTAVQGISGDLGSGRSTGDGVYGVGKNGVHGQSYSPTGIGVFGESQGGDGVVGLCTSNAHAGVSATNDSGGFGVWARGTPAGHFEGNVVVTGDLCLINQDCAEDFDISGTEDIEPGTVMVIQTDGALQISECAYDKRVAGVISGAGDLKPGIILGKQQSQANRLPIALLGKVYCKVDASAAPIGVGDLLTTSSTRGYAMKAVDPLLSFGAVLGKALRPLESGLGLIPILIALQ